MIWIYLSGVLPAIIMMLWYAKINKIDIYLTEVIYVVICSLFSYFTVLSVIMTIVSEKIENYLINSYYKKPIIKWK